MSTSRSIRIDAALVSAAEAQGKPQKRSAPSQIEFWAEIGRQVAPLLSPLDLVALSQGLLRLQVERVPSAPLVADEVFAEVARNSRRPFVSPAAAPAAVRYEASRRRKGLLDRVDATGNRTTGHFRNGQFVAE